MTADPIPAEISERIMHAHEATRATILTRPADYAAHWRAVAAAKHELADAYEAAVHHAAPGTVLRVALQDACDGVLDGAHQYEEWAKESEARAKAGGRA